MDEQKLQELFRDAASAAPPASFEEQDIVRGSRRVTARRRMAAAGGSVVAAAVIIGGVGVGTGTFNTGTPVAAPPATVKPRTPETKPGGPWVMTVPSGGQECAAPDADLARALAAELPDAAGSTPVAATGCPPESRSAAFSLRDGRVTAMVSPVGTVPPDQMRPGETQRPDGTKQFMVKAHSGRIVLVSSHGNGASAPPHGDRLSAIAQAIADRF